VNRGEENQLGSANNLKIEGQSTNERIAFCLVRDTRLSEVKKINPRVSCDAELKNSPATLRVADRAQVGKGIGP